jgi:predicted permease
MSLHPEPSWRRYLTFWRPNIRRDVDAEIRFHFDERVADLIARGRTMTAARAEADAEFGDAALVRERLLEIDHRVEARRSRGEWMHRRITDVRYALRSMRRTPGLTMTVVTLLALGIGANAAIFSTLDRIMLRPPSGVHAPGELRRLYGDYRSPPPMPGFVRSSFNYAEIADMSEALGPAQPLAAYESDRYEIGTAENAPTVQVADVMGNYFGVLGVRPWRGRFFAPEELEIASPHLVAVVSHRFWTRYLGADSAILGKPIQVTRRQFVVIGIAPPGFDGIDLDAVDIWRPANYLSAGSTASWYRQRNGSSIQVITRIGEGTDERELAYRANVGLHRADDRLADSSTVMLGSIIAARGPGNETKETSIALRLAGVTIVVLLIAIANVANLLLTRAIERRREIAVRVALGVSRARLAAQLITESAVMALVAGTVATIVAAWGALLIRGLLLPDIRWAGNPFDLRLTLFTFMIALVAAAAAGLLPFARASRFDLAASMRGGARDGGGHRSRTRGALIIAQAALSVVLLAGAGLFLRSLHAVQQLDIGYDTGLITAIPLSGRRVIPPAERAVALTAARERIAGLPGVRAAALSSLAPMSGFSADMIRIPGRESMPTTAGGPPTFTAVSPEFFKAAGVSIRKGRGFLPADDGGAPLVMIVTETMARLVWPDEDAIGKCARLGDATAPCTKVIGVAEDVRRDKVIEGPMLQYYLPLAQGGASRIPRVLIVSADADRIPGLNQEIHSILLQSLPGGRVTMATLAERLAPQYRPWQVGATLFTAFGVLALIVAALGVYSAITYSVTQRTHELGVRLALGAQRMDVGRLVVGSGVRLVAIGVGAGVLLAMAMSRLVDALLYGTDSRDPVVLVSVAGILLVIALIAASVPAWRATRLDPVKALRSE